MVYNRLLKKYIIRESDKAYLIEVIGRATTSFYYTKDLSPVSFWVAKSNTKVEGDYLLIEGWVDIWKSAIINANDRLVYKDIKLLNKHNEIDMKLWNPNNSSTWYSKEEYKELGIDLRADSIDLSENIHPYYLSVTGGNHIGGDAGIYGDSIDSVDGMFY